MRAMISLCIAPCDRMTRETEISHNISLFLVLANDIALVSFILYSFVSRLMQLQRMVDVEANVSQQRDAEQSEFKEIIEKQTALSLTALTVTALWGIVFFILTVVGPNEATQIKFYTPLMGTLNVMSLHLMFSFAKPMWQCIRALCKCLCWRS